MNKQIYINVADADTGEYYKLIKNQKTTDNKLKFIKFFTPLYDLLPILTPAELTIIKFICNNIRINKHTIILTHESTHLPKSSFYRSVNHLTELNILLKHNYPNMYTVNDTMLMNGRK